MEKIKRYQRLGFLCILWMLATFVIQLSGCSYLPRTSRQQESSQEPAYNQPMQHYYVFTDVLVPKEMKEDRKNTFMYHTSGMGLGMLTLKGRVDAGSLIDFFDNNMPKDNWRYVSSFKSARTLLIFQKEKRYCVIIVYEQQFFTYAEIWVAPVG